MINQDETNKVYSPLWHQIYAIVRAGGDYYAIASEIEELLTPISPSPQTEIKRVISKWSLILLQDEGKDIVYNRTVLQEIIADITAASIIDSDSPVAVTTREVTDEEIYAESYLIHDPLERQAFEIGMKRMRDLLTKAKEAK